MNIVFSAQAKAGLREIALFIARDNPVRARSFVQELRVKAIGLAEQPEAFPLVPRHAIQGIRCRRFHDYLIFYRVEAGRILIVHIMHGARDYEASLFPDS